MYRVGSAEVALPRIQANQIILDAATLREIVLPRRNWVVEELDARARAVRPVRQPGRPQARAGVLWPGVRHQRGLYGSRQLGHRHRRRRAVWLPVAVGDLLANLMAILMQTLSAKLGIATGKSLPEVCRDRYPRWASVALWVTAELAAMATDLAEFLGGAVGFNLLFGIPLFPAALLTGVVISLILLLERYGFRKVEMVIIGLIAVIGFVYMTEIWLSKPAWGEIGRGLLMPSMPIGATLVAVGIIGATVMPHNLYLHSALIQTRVRPSRFAAAQAAGLPAGDHGFARRAQRRVLCQRRHPGHVGGGVFRRAARTNIRSNRRTRRSRRCWGRWPARRLPSRCWLRAWRLRPRPRWPARSSWTALSITR